MSLEIPNYVRSVSKELKILTVSHNSFRMAVVYVPMYFKCKICFTVYTGETKINDTYLPIY